MAMKEMHILKVLIKFITPQLRGYHENISLPVQIILRIVIDYYNDKF